MKKEDQPTHKVFKELEKQFLSVRPTFSGMPDFAEYNLTLKYYKRLGTKNLSTSDFRRDCAIFSKLIANLKKDANIEVNFDDD